MNAKYKVSISYISKVSNFICIVSAKRWERGIKKKIQNENICLHQESNKRPIAFQA